MVYIDLTVNELLQKNLNLHSPWRKFQDVKLYILSENCKSVFSVFLKGFYNPSNYKRQVQNRVDYAHARHKRKGETNLEIYLIHFFCCYSYDIKISNFEIACNTKGVTLDEPSLKFEIKRW